jgi:hypothetical protein
LSSRKHTLFPLEISAIIGKISAYSEQNKSITNKLYGQYTCTALFYVEASGTHIPLSLEV